MSGINYELISALINGGDNNITADSFRGSFLDFYDNLGEWDDMLSFLQNENSLLNHWFVRQTDFADKETVMKYITDKADRDFNFDFFLNPDTPHWNNSLQQLINSYNEHIYALNDVGGDIPSGYRPQSGTEHMFKVADIRDANAGNDYGSNYYNLSIEEQHNKNDIEWVKAWENIDNQTYIFNRKYSRNGSLDAIIPVLNSQHEVQFTQPDMIYDVIFKGAAREDIFNALEIIKNCCNPDINHDEKIDMVDASQILIWEPPYDEQQLKVLEVYGDEVIYTPEEVAQMIQEFYVAQQTDNGYTWPYYLYVKKYEKPDDIIEKGMEIYTTTHYHSYMRLIMPKYSRRVEVEDLNRNFWVIAQTLSALEAFLFGDESPYKDVFKGLLDETCQLWENVLYLWVAAAAISTQGIEYDKIQTVFLPLYNSDLQNYVKYDNFDQTKTVDNDVIIERLINVINEYPTSHVVIVPEIRSNNYKNNYYATAYYPGIFTYNRITDTWDIIPIEKTVDLTNWAHAGEYGSLKTQGDQYYYAAGTVPSSSHFILIRPELTIDPYYDAYTKEISFYDIDGNGDVFILDFHDVATEIMSTVPNQSVVPYQLVGDYTTTTENITPTVISTDAQKTIDQGFYQGELISFNKFVQSIFHATITKTWSDNVESNREATLTITDAGTNQVVHTEVFRKGTHDEIQVDLPAQREDETMITYNISETIAPVVDESWTTTYSTYVLNSNITTANINNILTKILIHNMEFKTVRIGDFYPLTFVDGTYPQMPQLSEITIEESSTQNESPYDKRTYGYGAYILEKNPATAWHINAEDRKLVFVDYYTYASSGTVSTTNGSDITYPVMDYYSVEYIKYLKQQGELGNIDESGIYAAKFGTNFWVGDNGSQWSGGIVYALVFYDGTTHEAEVVAYPNLFDGYWTSNSMIFSSHGYGSGLSRWRRLELKCDTLGITETGNIRSFDMTGGKLTWYDHWNDINPSWGISDRRPNMDMNIDTFSSKMIFSNPVDELSPSELEMALEVVYTGDYDGHLFYISNVQSENKISVDRPDYTQGGPIKFARNYNIQLSTGSAEANECYID